MARPSRHTSFGGRADAAPDSPVPAQDVAKEARKAAKALWWREHRGKASSPSLDKPLDSLDQTRQQTRQPLDKPSGTTLDNRLDRLDNALGELAATSALLLRGVKSLVTRMDAMEAWGEALEARLSVRRSVNSAVPTALAPPTVSNVAATGRQAKRYQMTIKGQRVTVTEGQAYSCYGVSGIAPWLDEDGNPIPE